MFRLLFFHPLDGLRLDIVIRPWARVPPSTTFQSTDDAHRHVRWQGIWQLNRTPVA